MLLLISKKELLMISGLSNPTISLLFAIDSVLCHAYMLPYGIGLSLSYAQLYMMIIAVLVLIDYSNTLYRAVYRPSTGRAMH
jgi:hypothetical protein